MRDVGLRQTDLFLGQIAHLWIVKHRLRLGQIALALLEPLVLRSDGACFGMFARESAVSIEIAHHIGRCQQGVEFLHAQDLSFEAVAEKVFHGGRLSGAGCLARGRQAVICSRRSWLRRLGRWVRRAKDR